MPITRKPSKKQEEEVVEKLIRRGGSVAQQKESKLSQKQVYVQLRLDKSLIEKIDNLVESRPIKIPRHQWLLEAIHEKIERDSAARENGP